MRARADSNLNRFLSAPSRVLWLYLLAALVMTFPLVLHLRSALPAGSGDVWQNYWNFWWWRTSLIDLGQSPYHSEYLFQPSGADLAFHTHSPFNMIVGMPVNLVWGEAAAYNFCILLGLWLAGWGMYLLVRDLTEDSRAAFLAGIIFAYFPQHLEQTLEHLNLASTQFLPLTLWFFFRTVRAGRSRNVVGLGGCFALNALCSWHLGGAGWWCCSGSRGFGNWCALSRAAASFYSDGPRPASLPWCSSRPRPVPIDQRDRLGRRLFSEAAGRSRH